MFTLSLIIVAALIYGVGKVLVRHLGWPTSIARLGQWCVALLAGAVVLSMLPSFAPQVVASIGPVPSVSLIEVVPVLLGVGLAVLGYVGWTRGAEERERRRKLDERTRFEPRQRAMPLPPKGHDEPAGFVPLPKAGAEDGAGDEDET